MNSKDNMQNNYLPEVVSEHIKLIIQRLEQNNDSKDAADALCSIRRQFFFSTEEENVLPCELYDPLGAHRYQVTPRMVHQYKNRVLILTTSKCFSHCRYCFRRSYTARTVSWLNASEIDEICEYLKKHEEVKEALLSGGDPLTTSDEELETLILRIRQVRPGILIRLCTRAPVFMPERINDKLINLLKKLKPVWVIPHINHPVEISEEYSPETVKALKMFIDAGIPVQSQTVLLKGVNDSVVTLEKLFHELTCIGVKPGYLFQGDLVPGTSHFRVPVKEGVKLYEQLRCELSGLSTPVFAVDLPDGGGKVNLLQLDSSLLNTKVSLDEENYIFKKVDTSVWKYPL